MAKFNFRLQGYLNLKEKLEDQRRQEYGVAMAEVEREKQKKQALLDEKDNQIIAFRRQVDEDIDPKSFTNYNNYIEFLKKQIIAQEKVIIEATQRAEKKRLELVEAMKDRKVLEKLRERQHEQYVLEEKLAEQKVLDEIVSYRFNNK